MEDSQPQASGSGFYQLAFPVDDLEAEEDMQQTAGADAALSGMVHSEINRVVNDNMSLQNKLDRQKIELAEARAQLRGYNGSLGFSLDSASDADIIRLESLRKDVVDHSALLEVFNVPEFCRILVWDLRPRIARLLTPCLPSYLAFMAFHFADHTNDEAGMTGLFSTLHVAIKETVAKSQDLDILGLWLVNSWSLLNMFRQYSGEDDHQEWSAGNTEKQHSHAFQTFNLEPFREKLRARVEECYQVFMKKAVEPVLAPKIVPGILQHESSQEELLSGTHQASNGKNGSSNNGKHGSNGMVRQESTTKEHMAKRSLEDLIAFLTFVHQKLICFGADPVLLGQVFGQITSWICALALNSLMFRKELCCFEKAVQFKHNVTDVQQWLWEHKLGDCRNHLEPLIQASHLLQSRKDESNLDVLCGEMTNRLKSKQIIALLQHYAPSENFEEKRLSADFLQKVAEKLRERATASLDLSSTSSVPTLDSSQSSDIFGDHHHQHKEDSPIMMGTYLTPFDSTPFVHSNFALETVFLPTCLHLQNVCRLL